MGARKRIMAEKLKEAKKQTAIAKLNDVPTSPRKMRLVADTVRGVEVNKALDNNRINSETLERQERILSRLLDASRSINERDFEEKRESKRGQDIIQNSPSELELHTQEGKAKVLRELMQSFKGSYTKDYENIIRRYLESLTK